VYRVLNVPVAQIGLQRSRVVPAVGQRAAAGVAQHMGVGSTMRAKPAGQ